MFVLFLIQLGVLGLLLAQAWKAASWTISVEASFKYLDVGERAARTELALTAEARRDAANDGCPTGVMCVSDLLEEDDRDAWGLALKRWSARDTYSLRRIARLASVTTMLSTVIAMSLGLSGGSGLQALQAGLPQRVALENVATSLSIGGGTIALYLWLTRRLDGRLSKLVAAAPTLGATRRGPTVETQ